MRSLQARTPSGLKTDKTAKTRKLRPSDTALTCGYTRARPPARPRSAPRPGHSGTAQHPVPPYPGTRPPPVPGHRGIGTYGVPTPYPLRQYGVRGLRSLACLACPSPSPSPSPTARALRACVRAYAHGLALCVRVYAHGMGHRAAVCSLHAQHTAHSTQHSLGYTHAHLAQL